MTTIKNTTNGTANGTAHPPVESCIPEKFTNKIMQMVINAALGLWTIITFGWMKKTSVNYGILGLRRKNNTWIKNEVIGVPKGCNVIKELESKNVTTLSEITQFVEEKYGDAPMVGTRKLIRRERIEEGKKILEKLHLGDYEWKTCREVNREVCQIASGFNDMGLKKGDRIALMAETRADWFVTAMGALKNGLTVVTLYTNLNDSGLAHGINETEIHTIVTSSDLLSRLAGILPICPTIKTIIVMEDQLEGIGNTKIPENIFLLPLSKLKGGVHINESNKPSADDLAIIMYTSGSSGIPKGVEITHSNIFHTLTSYLSQVNIGIGDIYLAFLPLAHIMEFTCEIGQMILGVNVAYGSPFTLTNSSPKIAKGSLSDSVVAKPTSITVVSLILDRIIKTVSLKVAHAGILQRKLFEKALHTKINNEHSVMSKIFDAVVFKKVRAELGGRVKLVVVGGAPLSPDTHLKVRAMFGCTIQCGYGCTETSASATSMQAFDTRTGHVGPPNSLAFIKLEDWQEGGYLTTDLPYARGEIIVGGGCIARGYFKNEEETNNAFYDSEGTRWFRTGDIGEFDESGVLRIIDRKKDLVKLANGEYVSLGSVESCLKTNCLVENICVFADSLQEHPVCVVVPNTGPFLKRAMKEFDVNGLTIEEACSNKQMCQFLLKELQDHGRKNCLNRWDIPLAIYLTPNPWTPESGLVTAAFKLRRRNLQAEYKTQIKSMYSK